MRRWPLGLAVLLLALFVSLSACGTGAKACAVVDIASDACTVVRYLGPDGKAEELSPEDLGDLARAKRTARERAQKAVP